MFECSLSRSNVQTQGNINTFVYIPRMMCRAREDIVRGLFFVFMGYNTHSFSVELATTLGLEKTLILQHFYYWHLSNKDNEGMFKDNHTWFFTSRKNILNTFPYLTERKIRDAIDKLIKDGYVLKGNYNPDKMKKTNWYALTKKSLKLFDQSLVNMSNDWSKCPTKDNINKDNNREKETISKDIVKKEEAPTNRMNIPLPFECKELRSLWKELMTYPEWKKKSAHAIELRVKTLTRLSRGDVDYCLAIVRQTLQKGWIDFYDVKDYKAPIRLANIPTETKVRTPWEEMGLSKEQYDKLYKG